MSHPRRNFPRALMSALVILLLAVGADSAERKKFRLGYLEGVAAALEQKEKAFNVIQKYTRLKDQN